MRFQKRKPKYPLNRLLTEYIPVIEHRDNIQIKARLIINYLLEIGVMMAVALNLYLTSPVTMQYLELFCHLGRLILFSLQFKLNKIDIAIVNKILIIITCFSMQQPSLTALSWLILILQIIHSLVLAFSGQQRRGKFDERLNLWIPFFKEIVLIAASFLIFEFQYSNQTGFYLLVICSLVHLLLSIMDEVYNFPVKKLLMSISIFNFVFVMCLIVLMAYPDFRINSVVIFGVAIFDIIGIWLYNFIEFTDFKIIEQNPSSFNEWQYMEYFRKMIYLIENKKTKEYCQILRGFYNFHLTICSSPQCPISYSHELDKQKQFTKEDCSETFELFFEQKIVFIQSYLKNQLQIATIKFPDIKPFFLFYISPSIEALKYCDREEFLQYRQYSRVEITMQDKDIEFKNQQSVALREEVKETMEQYIDLSNSLWRLLYDENVNMKKLEELGNRILILKEKIKGYQKLKSLDAKTIKYIMEFKNHILDQKIPVNNYIIPEEHNKLLNFVDIQSKEQPILIVSAEPESFERLENANASCCSLLGYSKQQLLQKNLNGILPEFIGDFHHKLMTERSKKLLYSEEKKINTWVYAVTGSGYLMETKLNILQLNSINGRRWSCRFQPTFQKNYVIITDEKGVVQGLTANCLEINISLNAIGKQFHQELFSKLTTDAKASFPLKDQLEDLYDQVDNQQQVQLSVKTLIIHELDNIKMCVFEISRMEKPVVRSALLNLDTPIVECQNPPFVYNFPNLYSNIDYNVPVDIKVPEEQHYDFVNFGEGINQMRYLDGQIQFKEDKSECSFTKENTNNQLVEIVNFNMKKETYLQALQISNKNLPKPLIELTALLILFMLTVIAIGLANFIIFYGQIQTNNTQINVLSSLGLWYFDFLQITAASMELGYINSSQWANNSQSCYTNMTSSLNDLIMQSKNLAQNESAINQFIAAYSINSTNSLYDVITNFKLQANTILNNQNTSYDFSTSSPITQMLSLMTNYLIPGFQSLLAQIYSNYSNINSSANGIYIIMFVCLACLALPFLFRVYVINRRLNEEKTKLLSIFLQVQESVVKKLIQKNNQFKLMIKYDKEMTSEEDTNDMQEEESQEQEKSARKRIKSVQKMYYFISFSLFTIICVGIYSINLSIELQYFNNLGSYMSMIQRFNIGHLTAEQVWLQLNTLVLYPTTTFQNQSNKTAFIINTVSNVYITQMKFREVYLMNLNAQLFSSNFVAFFLAFWVTNGCNYMTYQGCTTDYNQIFTQGVDQVWSMLVRKVDYLGSQAIAAMPLNASYIPTFAALAPNYVSRNITTFYSQDILISFNYNLVNEIQTYTQTALTYKTIIFAGLITFIVVVFVIFVTWRLKKMRSQMERVERIVGFIPFKQLVNINEFKLYIRKKYENQIY